jgi:hypothetical protein
MGAVVEENAIMSGCAPEKQLTPNRYKASQFPALHHAPGEKVVPGKPSLVIDDYPSCPFSFEVRHSSCPPAVGSNGLLAHRHRNSSFYCHPQVLLMTVGVGRYYHYLRTRISAEEIGSGIIIPRVPSIGKRPSTLVVGIVPTENVTVSTHRERPGVSCRFLAEWIVFQ